MRPPPSRRADFPAPSPLTSRDPEAAAYWREEPLAPPQRAGRPLDALAWDPLCAAAAEIKLAFVEPVRTRVFEALGVLKELGGQQLEIEDDLAVDAFTFALVDGFARAHGLPEDRLDRLLQLIAAQIFYSPRNPSIRNKSFFWGFLKDLSEKYRARPDSGDGRIELSAVLDQFLGHYRLNGAENGDVIAGLRRLVSPLVERLTELLRDQRLRVP